MARHLPHELSVPAFLLLRPSGILDPRTELCLSWNVLYVILRMLKLTFDLGGNHPSQGWGTRIGHAASQDFFAETFFFFLISGPFGMSGCLGTDSLSQHLSRVQR